MTISSRFVFNFVSVDKTLNKYADKYLTMINEERRKRPSNTNEIFA